MPASPGFYGLPRSLDDLVDFMVAKALDHLGVEHELMARWGEARTGGPMTAARARTASGRLPAGEVRAMFDRIAPRYDLLNRTMTAGLDGRWRRAAAAAADLAAGDRALDVCIGTGDLAFALADRVTASGEVVGVDFAEGMVGARARKAARRPERRRFQVADALALPFADGAFDAATVAFGIRNVADLDAGPGRDGARGAPRRAGGRCSRSRPRPSLRRFYGLWFDRVDARASGGCSAATAPPTPTCRRRCAASPSRRSWPRAWPRPASTDVRWRAAGGRDRGPPPRGASR